MTIKNMKSILATNKFDNVECNFKLKSKGPQAPAWFKDYEERINNRFDKIEARIDKLENLVITEFTKHGWIK